MAKPNSITASYLLAFFALSLALAWSSTTIPAAHADDHHHMKWPVRQETFRVFWQDFLNVTDYIVLLGIPGVGLGNITPVGAPFGTMICFNDPLTEGPETDSKQMGTVTGTGIVSSFDGLTTFWAFTFTLNTTQYKGTLSFLAPLATTVTAKAPIVGGTDDFLFAQGHAITNPVAISSFNTTYSVDLHVYWPPYMY